MATLATTNSSDRDIGERRFEQIIGSGPALETVLEQVQRVAPTYSTVLIEKAKPALVRNSLRGRFTT